MNPPEEVSMDFPRQMEPVEISFTGDQRDVTHYLNKVKRCLENNYDTVVRVGNQLKVYPAANND